MDKTRLIELISESAKIPPGKQLKRDYEESLKSTLTSARPIKVLTGLRRSGKSFLLKRLYAEILARGIPRENLLFVNFESDLARDYLSLDGLRDMVLTFKSAAKPANTLYMFLDEIQNVPLWHKYVRTLYDSEALNCFLTGSNSKLLSGEIGSALGGRTIEFEIRPFTFRELLEFNGLDCSNPHELAANAPQVKQTLDDYYEYGGIPESLDLAPFLKEAYRKSLIEKILINDIISRHNLASPGQLTDLLAYLERSLGGVASARNLAKHAPLSDATVAKYLDFLSQAFLVRPLRKYHFQARTILDTQKKFYFADNLFCHYSSAGAKLENLVYAELSRTYGADRVFFARNTRGQEVDFVVMDANNRLLKAVQVAYELNQDNLTRELAPLELLLKYARRPTEACLVCCVDRTNAAKLPSRIKLFRVHDWLIQRTA